ncbi:hypothetical protein PUNSTDRAFT_120776 [Punctularia strigosozonata HHB-11173 SS5]|uniref:uncharacterized protein n=1 Tax=Punctularia strigosozonata (strain HHB-11173) TaxID=741275 RepID=UPI00044166B0|nr:uncharacterized protein PUNSTDRAFT_120776 [Punctularia strigosozonata HHB-11173 SS5]EIN08402.1 hypothetical protein PUNSTDRAFT_120776 [Punctularia strigosozonata HHB-11173 SS5]
MSGIVRRLWQRIMAPNMVGRDLQGNRFFEYPNPLAPERPKRMVKYKDSGSMLNWNTLPVQWQMWMTHTRRNPPTIEELQADLVRRERVARNVALLEQSRREEASRLAQSSDLQLSVEAPKSQQTPPTRNQIPDEVNVKEAAAPSPNPWKAMVPGSDQPQPWSPRAVNRGGS